MRFFISLKASKDKHHLGYRNSLLHRIEVLEKLTKEELSKELRDEKLNMMNTFKFLDARDAAKDILYAHQ